MKLPDVNLNGTSREELRDQNYEARHALAMALSKLGNAAPHGRDYQTQGDQTAIYRALEEHAERVRHLRQVLSELEIIAEHLS